MLPPLDCWSLQMATVTGNILPGERQRASLARRETITFYLCISPWLLGLLLFVLWPMVASLVLSFTRWDLLSPIRSSRRRSR